MALLSFLNKIKTKISNFDIKPAEPQIGVKYQQAYDLYKNNEKDSSVKLLHKILLLSPGNYKALSLLSDIYIETGELKPALNILHQAVRAHPNHAWVYSGMAFVYAELGKKKKAIQYCNKSLNINPKLESTKHLLDFLTEKNPSRPSKKYIIDLFNDYAEHFELSLQEKLYYQAPQQTVKFLLQTFPERFVSKGLSCLDLGCGTGLLAKELITKLNFHSIYGVDLSDLMLAKAQQKSIYNNLVQDDIIEYLQDCDTNFDLIASTDALIYLGNLSEVFKHAYTRLKPKGVFCFTVEDMPANNGDFTLCRQGRYQHADKYLKQLSIQYGFKHYQSKLVELRLERLEPVIGNIAILQK